MSARSEAATMTQRVGARQWRQALWITLAAVALYVGFRNLPTGSNLNHIDFRTGGSPGSLEMCDPANPQFIPVIAVRSPVSMTLISENGPATAGREVKGVVRLATASGKPIGPVDLLVMHTRKLHLLVTDPSLRDYQHLHPEPGEKPGEWVFHFTPRYAGLYRVFGDFTPVATGRGLYSGADLEVAPADSVANTSGSLASEAISAERIRTQQDGYDFTLTVSDAPLRAGRAGDLAFSIARADGGAVALRPVMDAYAHLVAFDEARSGFAHLHPNEIDLSQPLDSREPRLTFKITIPKPGRYVVWAQVKLGDEESFVPFPVEVL